MIQHQEISQIEKDKAEMIEMLNTFLQIYEEQSKKQDAIIKDL